MPPADSHVDARYVARMNDSLSRYIHTLETLERGTLAQLLALCHPDIHFRDPFNDCHGVDAFGRVMGDMFDKLDAVDFSTQHVAWSANDEACALVQWTLRAKLRALANQAWSVEGCSVLHVGGDGNITAHYDYWDAAAGLYERIPLIGFVLRSLRRRIRVR